MCRKKLCCQTDRWVQNRNVMTSEIRPGLMPSVADKLCQLLMMSDSFINLKLISEFSQMCYIFNL